jgi:hypothetical protein
MAFYGFYWGFESLPSEALIRAEARRRSNFPCVPSCLGDQYLENTCRNSIPFVFHPHQDGP